MSKQHELIHSRVSYKDGRRKRVVTGEVVDTKPGSLLNIDTMEEVKGICFKIKQDNGKCIWTCAYPEKESVE